jgi:AcrR family transcriptional regulator
MTLDPKISETIAKTLFPSGITKSERTKVRILEGAIGSICEIGVHNTTFESVAERALVTKQLVRKYFVSKDELFEWSVTYIRAVFQEWAVGAIKLESTPKKQMTSYVKSCFSWPEVNPRHFQVWLLMFHYASIFNNYRQFHTKFTKAGQERIVGLIESGNKSGDFKCANPAETAKVIQSIITGALMSLYLEELPLNRDRWIALNLELCLVQLGQPKSKSRKQRS